MNTLDILFIIGLPRSGTSLVQKLVQEETGRKSPRFKDFGIDLAKIPRHIKEMNKTLRDENSLAEDNDFNGTLTQYRNWLESRGSHWVCKSPDHIGQMPELVDVFPEARFLWCIREPSHTMESAKEYFMLTGLSWPYNPHKALNDALYIAKTGRNEFDFVDVEQLPNWSSELDSSPRWKHDFDDVYDELRGVAKRVQFSVFKERYRIV